MAEQISTLGFNMSDPSYLAFLERCADITAKAVDNPEVDPGPTDTQIAISKVAATARATVTASPGLDTSEYLTVLGREISGILEPEIDPAPEASPISAQIGSIASYFMRQRQQNPNDERWSPGSYQVAIADLLPQLNFTEVGEGR